MENVNKLFDQLKSRGALKTDGALADVLGWKPPEISRMRHGGVMGKSKRYDICKTFFISVEDLERQLSTVPVCTNEQQAA
jgi:hypothetical protein